MTGWGTMKWLINQTYYDNGIVMEPKELIKDPRLILCNTTTYKLIRMCQVCGYLTRTGRGRYEVTKRIPITLNSNDLAKEYSEKVKTFKD